MRANKKLATALFVIVTIQVLFATYQLYKGNFEAAYSTLPFLVIMFFAMKLLRR